MSLFTQLMQVTAAAAFAVIAAPVFPRARAAGHRIHTSAALVVAATSRNRASPSPINPPKDFAFVARFQDAGWLL